MSRMLPPGIRLQCVPLLLGVLFPLAASAARLVTTTDETGNEVPADLRVFVVPDGYEVVDVTTTGAYGARDPVDRRRFPGRVPPPRGGPLPAGGRSPSVDLALRPARTGPGLVRERANPAAERAVRAAIAALVENPEKIPEGAAGAAEGVSSVPRDLPSSEGSAVDMVIVTTTELETELQTLADWKTAKGVPTVVRTLDWIDAS